MCEGESSPAWQGGRRAGQARAMGWSWPWQAGALAVMRFSVSQRKPSGWQSSTPITLHTLCVGRTVKVNGGRFQDRHPGPVARRSSGSRDWRQVAGGVSVPSSWVPLLNAGARSALSRAAGLRDSGTGGVQRLLQGTLTTCRGCTLLC